MKNLLMTLFLISITPVLADGPDISTQSRVVSVTPVISNGVAYLANDAVGGLMTFVNATGRKRTSLISNVTVLDKSKQNAALDLICAHSSFTATADNAPLAISDADGLNVISITSITSYTDIGAASVAVAGNVGQLVSTNTDKNLYCQLVTRGTPTYTSVSDLQVTISFLQD